MKYAVGAMVLLFIVVIHFLFVIPDLLLVLLILNVIVNLDWIANKIVKLLKRQVTIRTLHNGWRTKS